ISSAIAPWLRSANQGDIPQVRRPEGGRPGGRAFGRGSRRGSLPRATDAVRGSQVVYRRPHVALHWIRSRHVTSVADPGTAVTGPSAGASSVPAEAMARDATIAVRNLWKVFGPAEQQLERRKQAPTADE